jgi:hypothetical protein
VVVLLVVAVQRRRRRQHQQQHRQQALRQMSALVMTSGVTLSGSGCWAGLLGQLWCVRAAHVTTAAACMVPCSCRVVCQAGSTCATRRASAVAAAHQWRPDMLVMATARTCRLLWVLPRTWRHHVCRVAFERQLVTRVGAVLTPVGPLVRDDRHRYASCTATATCFTAPAHLFASLQPATD